jgi:hypothetical protein
LSELLRVKSGSAKMLFAQLPDRRAHADFGLQLVPGFQWFPHALFEFRQDFE